ncbi:MAG: ankyrin repeat domain-containing protein [Acidobacteriota bacterium]
MSRRLFNLSWVGFAAAIGLLCSCPMHAQEGLWPPQSQPQPSTPPASEPREAPREPSRPRAIAVEVPPPEPISPREALFLAIELRDIEAAREALRNGAEAEINLGNPSPLATAALHDDVRMVALLLSFGGNPGTTKDSPLEEAVRHENVRIVELLLRSGARVPAAGSGVEMFRLAQRGSKAQELSKALLDSGGNPDLCLIAATRSANLDLMRFCLSRSADVGALPEDLNILSVALASEDAGFVGQVLGYGLEDRVLAGALRPAITVGNMDVVQRAVTAGAKPAFGDVEAAVESGGAEIGLFLLDQTAPKDSSVLAGGDVRSLIQRTDDLGLSELSSALRRKAGLSTWSLERLLPFLVGVALVLALVTLVGRNLGRSTAPKVSISGVGPSTGRRRPDASRPSAPAPVAAGSQQSVPTDQPQQSAAPRADLAPAFEPLSPAADEMAAPAPAPQPSAVAAASVPLAEVLAAQEVAPIPAQSAPAPTAQPAGPALAPPAPVEPPPASPAPQPAAQAVPQPAAPAMPAAAAVSAPPAGEGAWEVAPDLAVPSSTANAPVAVVPQATPGFEVKMPEVDLSHSADRVFAAARQAAAAPSNQPQNAGRRNVALVAPSRVTLLHPCPVPGSLRPEQLAMAERLVPSTMPRNVSVIAYNELEAVKSDISQAIPFFQLLSMLGYLGHAVWIFEGHVSAMAAGCQDADILIVDDGMMRFLPGNWRSVASRVMRGQDFYVFERQTGNLRRLK